MLSNSIKPVRRLEEVHDNHRALTKQVRRDGWLLGCDDGSDVFMALLAHGSEEAICERYGFDGLVHYFLDFVKCNGQALAALCHGVFCDAEADIEEVACSRGVSEWTAQINGGDRA